jgi:thioesterase domain-containing protein
VDDLANFYLDEIKKTQPQGPYYLSGYSGGGIAAFEIARKLTASGEQVAFLGFIDSYCPELPQRSMSERAEIHLARLREQGPKYVTDTIGRRIIKERYEMGRRVSRQLRRFMPQRFRYEQIEDSWLVAQDAYRPPPWDGKATLFRARELGSISLWTGFKDDELHGWGRYLLRGVEVRYCPGDHNSMCEEPNVRVLAAQFREAVDKSAAELGEPPAAAQASDSSPS